jgi:hypothetical protein
MVLDRHLSMLLCRFAYLQLRFIRVSHGIAVVLFFKAATRHSKSTAKTPSKESSAVHHGELLRLPVTWCRFK